MSLGLLHLRGWLRLVRLELGLGRGLFLFSLSFLGLWLDLLFLGC